MKRRTLIRFQLFLLIALVGVILVRVFQGEPKPDGTVVLVDLASGKLYQQAFLVEEPTQVALDVAGSVGRLSLLVDHEDARAALDLARQGKV